MSAPHHLYSPDEYLSFEKGVESRHEYVDGQIYAMAGAGLQHGRVVRNLAVALGTQLRGGPCEALVESARIRAGARRAYLYPDAVGLCDDARFEGDRGMETLLDPLFVVEVLSPSTEAYDRGRKFELYRSIPSLREYVLVSQDRVHAERYVAPGDRSAPWGRLELDGADAVLAVPSVGATLRLGDLYERVEFPPRPRRVREPEPAEWA